MSIYPIKAKASTFFVLKTQQYLEYLSLKCYQNDKGTGTLSQIIRYIKGKTKIFKKAVIGY